jgi:hypothetical protein
MMTASPGAIDTEAGTLSTLGIADLLEKPISGEELAQTITRILSGKREARS